MMTDEQAAAIQERAEKATESNILFAGALATSILRVASFQSDAQDEANVLFAINARTDIPALLADRAERTRLLREVLQFKDEVDHIWTCPSTHETGLPCECGRDALLSEITEAVK